MHGGSTTMGAGGVGRLPGRVTAGPRLDTTAGRAAVTVARAVTTRAWACAARLAVLAVVSVLSVAYVVAATNNAPLYAGF